MSKKQIQACLELGLIPAAAAMVVLFILGVLSATMVPAIYVLGVVINYIISSIVWSLVKPEQVNLKLLSIIGLGVPAAASGATASIIVEATMHAMVNPKVFAIVVIMSVVVSRVGVEIYGRLHPIGK